MYNRTILIGRITKDLELRYSPNGIAVVRFTLAVNRRYTQNGEQEADFIPIVAWRGLAENCANYLRKGSLVGLEGRLQVRSYENQEGRTVWTTEVIADDVRFLEPKNRTETTTAAQPAQPAQSRPAQTKQRDPFGDGKQINIPDDDFPW
jgi:single-strand DNA-binding protein